MGGVGFIIAAAGNQLKIQAQPGSNIKPAQNLNLGSAGAVKLKGWIQSKAGCGCVRPWMVRPLSTPNYMLVLMVGQTLNLLEFWHIPFIGWPLFLILEHIIKISILWARLITICSNDFSEGYACTTMQYLHNIFSVRSLKNWRIIGPIVPGPGNPQHPYMIFDMFSKTNTLQLKIGSSYFHGFSNSRSSRIPVYCQTCMLPMSFLSKPSITSL